MLALPSWYSFWERRRPMQRLMVKEDSDAHALPQKERLKGKREERTILLHVMINAMGVHMSYLWVSIDMFVCVLYLSSLIHI
jgi:hypothetical protein